MSRFIGRVAFAALLALTVFAAAAHRADAYQPDGEWDCDGGFYSVFTNAQAGGQVVNCLGAIPGSRSWMRVRTSASPSRVTEGANGATTTVTLTLRKDGLSSTPLPIRVRTQGGSATAGQDYDAIDTVVRVPYLSGATSITLPLTVRGDDVLEGDETVGIVGEAVGWPGTTSSNRTQVIVGGTTVTIVDDEPGAAPDEGVDACTGGFGYLESWHGHQLAACLGGIAGNGTFTFTSRPDGPVVERRFDEAIASFTIRRTAARTAVPVHFETEAISASANDDFDPVSGDVLFRAGETERTVRVAVPWDENVRNGDPTDTYAEDAEGAESFRLDISGVGIPIAVPVSAPITVHDSDIAPLALEAPTVTGAGTVVGIALHAGDGAWLNQLATTRTWQRCDSGSTCTTIPGATGTSYVPTAADVGATIRLAVKSDGAPPLGSAAARTTTATADASAPIAALLASPTFTTAPTGELPSGSDARFEVGGVLADATLECRLDGDAWGACAADRTVSGLGAGAHTYAVRQRLEGASSAEVERAFTIATPVTPPAPDEDDEEEPTPAPGDGQPTTETPRGDEPGTTTATPTSPAASAAATPATAAPAGPPTPAAPILRPESARRVATAVSPDGVRLGAWCPGRCTLTAKLTVSADDARRLGLRDRTIGSARGAAPAASRAHLRVRFGTAARRALPRTTRPVRILVTYAGEGAPRPTVLVLRP